jgi:hypothetical protein
MRRSVLELAFLEHYPPVGRHRAAAGLTDTDSAEGNGDCCVRNCDLATCSTLTTRSTLTSVVCSTSQSFPLGEDVPGSVELRAAVL